MNREVLSSTHWCYEMGYESGGQAAAAGAAAGLCHTGTNKLNWRCRRVQISGGSREMVLDEY
jgi:hypothetical protein